MTHITVGLWQAITFQDCIPDLWNSFSMYLSVLLPSSTISRALLVSLAVLDIILSELSSRWCFHNPSIHDSYCIKRVNKTTCVPLGQTNSEPPFRHCQALLGRDSCLDVSKLKSATKRLRIGQQRTVRSRSMSQCDAEKKTYKRQNMMNVIRVK